MVRERPRESKGFTVVELIVALILSATTLLSGYELFEALKGTGDVQTADLAAAAAIVHGFDQIREDLWHAVPRSGSREPIFVGGNPSSEPKEETTKLLEFYALCASRSNDPVGNLRQMHQVRYELARDNDSVCLYRDVTPVVGPRPTWGAEGREPILERVEQLQIAFRNGRSSEPSFSSNEKLPACVELTVMIDGRIWPLSVKLPCGVSEGQQ
jgi:type II secretion system protein J